MYLKFSWRSFVRRWPEYYLLLIFFLPQDKIHGFPGEEQSKYLGFVFNGALWCFAATKEKRNMKIWIPSSISVVAFESPCMYCTKNKRGGKKSYIHLWWTCCHYSSIFRLWANGEEKANERNKEMEFCNCLLLSCLIEFCTSPECVPIFSACLFSLVSGFPVHLLTH